MAVLLYGALALYAFLLSDRLIFLPPVASYTAADLPISLVETSDGAHVAMLYLPKSGSAYTLLYSHGNAEDLGHTAPVLHQLQEAGFSVLAYDYRGYGQSTGGPPGAEGAYRDIAAVFTYATEQLQIPASRILLYGRSVGSGPATDLAARVDVGGLIIESGFTSTFRVVTGIPLLPFDKFPNLKNIQRVRSPVLIIHGMDDEVIPFSHGEMLYAAAPEPKSYLWIDGAGHNDVAWVAGDAYWNALKRFAEALESDVPGTPI